MKRKYELNIEVLSNIKDEIIDKQSAKRYSLMNKKRKPKWIIPSSVAAVLLIAIMIPLFIVLFSKQVPIYEGMTVLSDYKPSTAEAVGVNMLSASGKTQIDFLKDDNGNHYGHDKKPVEDIVEDDSSISLTVPDQQMYYTEPNQDIYINIHFSNPDDFVILSFVFNGKTYSSYMFEDGSDMENIIIKCSIGDIEGIVEYTIDAIKYVDGTAIKDVVMAGDKTIKVGVYSAGKQPTAQIADEVVGINNISFTASINDQLELIKMSEGEVLAILCNDDTVISQQKLTLGEVNNINFDGLDKDTTYRYAIVANYDSLDGTGFNTYVLYKKEFTTKEVVVFDSVSVSQESVSFTLEWEESFENKVLDSLTLYKGEEKIFELDVNAVSVNGLLSNNEYRLVATYTNNGETETSDLTFTTQANSIPEITITENSKTQTSIGFDISVTDIDSVGDITKLELIHGEDVQNIADLSTREFTDLLSDNTYTIKVTYTYDLNDGTGSHTIEKTVNITTHAKATPNITITGSSKTQTSIGFDISVTDVDSVGAITKLEHIHGEDAQNIADLNTREFTDLLSNNTYTIKVTYTYDLNDGVGEHTIEKTIDITTEAKAEPTFDFSDIVCTQYTVSGKYNITDIDNLLSSYKVELYRGDELIGQPTDKAFHFQGLDYYTDYEIVITYSFDLNDGNGNQTKTLEYKIKTLPYIDTTEVKIRNSEAIFEGDTIYIQVIIDNPLNATVTDVSINGIYYAVTTASSNSSLFVEIKNDSRFEGGETTLSVEGFKITIDGKAYNIYAKTLCSDTLFVNGNVNIVSVEFVDTMLSTSLYGNQFDELFVLVSLDNPTGYNIESLELNIGTYYTEDMIFIDNEHFYVPVSKDTIYDGFNNILYANIICGNNYIDRISVTLGDPNDFQPICKPYYYLNTGDENDDGTRYISSVQDFMNISNTGNHYYELTCDLDFSNVSGFTGIDLQGIFNGNGYAIKNVSVIGSYDLVGIFSNVNGIVENLSVENLIYIIEHSNNKECTVGGIVGLLGWQSIISNCTIDENSIISVINNGTVTFPINVGGISGSVNTSFALISGCENRAAISVSKPMNSGVGYVSLGGIAGRCPTIVDCENYGAISYIGMDHVGGIAGESASIISCKNYGEITVYCEETEHWSDCQTGGIAAVCTEISDCVNYGDICVKEATTILTHQYYVGGICGSTFKTTECVNFGNIIQKGTIRALAAGIVGYGSDGIVENCINYGDIDGCGIVGSRGGGSSGLLTIRDCINIGDVSGYNASGIFYFGGSSGLDVYVENCVNIGIVNDLSSRGGAGIILGEATFGSESIVADNCYTKNIYLCDTKFDDVHQCTADQLNSKEFYTETLGWSEDVWDFSELDFENGKYPKLK